MTQDEIEKLSDKWSNALGKGTGKNSSEKKVDVAKFLEACENGEIDFVRAALESDSSLANARGEWQLTALMQASRNGHTDVARLLIDKGADVNATNEEEQSALMFAVGDNRDYPAMVKLLLESGADVNYVSHKYRMSALDCAQIGGLTKSIAILKSWGGFVADKLDSYY